MSKKIFSIKTLLAFCAVVCLTVVAGFMSMPKQTTAKADGESSYLSEIKQVEYFTNEDLLLVHFSNTDYMTAEEWSAPYDYKWVASLTLENKTTANVHNAVLDKNLSKYNFENYILIDGVPLGSYSYSLKANSLTRVEALGIAIDPGVLANAQIITFKAGCTIPTLHHSYFGVAEYSEIVIEEEISFAEKGGVWSRYYPFDGYEAGVQYDACEKYLYLRSLTGNFKGHIEAPTYEFTTIFSDNGWGDDDYTLATSADTQEGHLVVFDFVNPIDVNEIGLIYLRLFSNVPRSFVTLNADNVTTTEFGPALETFTIPGGSFSTISLLAPLYANADGLVETIVLQFTESGSENYELNQFFLGSFELATNEIGSEIYTESFLVSESEDTYDLTFRFNKKGEYNDKISLSTSKVLVNGVSIDEINAEGDYAQAEWVYIPGIYQISVKISKEYQGPGQIKNPELDYAGNSMTVAEGLIFPNGRKLTETYTCHIYRGENLVDRDLVKEYKETKITSIEWLFDPTAANNIHMRFHFDAPVSSQAYYHADQIEPWREASLYLFKGMYDADMTKVYIAGGYKSALYDSIVINGKTLGEWHAVDEYTTCMFVHYAQVAYDALEVSIDSNSEIYKMFKVLYESGQDVTIEVKAGLKFMSGTRTEENRTFVLTDGEFVMQGATASEMNVYYNGVAVSQGATISSQTEALIDNIDVDGVEGYAVDALRNGNVVEFKITTLDGQKFSFAVEEDIVSEPAGSASNNPLDSLSGCTANLSNSAFFGGVCLLLAAIPVMRRRKDNEE